MSKRRALTEEQTAELRRRYGLFRENHPKKLAGEFGISRQTLLQYVFDRHKRRGRAPQKGPMAAYPPKGSGA